MEIKVEGPACTHASLTNSSVMLEVLALFEDPPGTKTRLGRESTSTAFLVDARGPV